MTDRARSVMIFAAGLGTRMRPLTDRLPKPMLPVAGQPMIDRAVQLARDAGAAPILANTHYLHHRIAPHLETLGVTVCHEMPDILDTGGGLKAARAHLTSPTFTLNPDVLWLGPNPLEVLADNWSEEADALLLVVPPERAVNRTGGGDFSLSDGRLIRGGDYIYSGAQLIHTEPLDGTPDPVFSLNRTWDILEKRETLMACVYPGRWLDIGTPEGLTLANRMVETGRV